MTPLDHLRLSFGALGDNLQHPISFGLVPAVVDDFRAQGTRSERNSIEILTAWLAQSRLSPRAVGELVSTRSH